ncbi:hypothetical protein [Ponticoccus alexandrii]|uniref:Uncharacterized protein n=1 Tax=Ponticoccus alexandrii TaxID=1943633 RepID=A0ABX7FCZ4_9RHOB|nr:hypothetical protein [Ponticoccus alexandrii]QRF67242.1 hypothetical protein GQA70_13545 [Ponticoccus alexandrii]
MSDPVTNVEIEDVLSSIRRLVTEETRPPRSKPEAAKAAPGRLVLTPSLRVHDAEPPAPRAVSVTTTDRTSDPVLLTNPTAVSSEAADRKEPDKVAPQASPEVGPQAEAAPVPEAWRGKAQEKDTSGEPLAGVQALPDKTAGSFWQQEGPDAVAAVTEEQADRLGSQAPATDEVGQEDAVPAVPSDAQEAEPRVGPTLPDDEDRNGTLARLVGEEVARSFSGGCTEAPLSDTPVQAEADRGGSGSDWTGAVAHDAGDAGSSAEPLPASSGADLAPMSQGEGCATVADTENLTSFDSKIAALQKLLDRAGPSLEQDAAAVEEMQARPTFVRSSTEAALEWEDHSPDSDAAPAATASSAPAGADDDGAEDAGGFDPVQARRDIDAEGDEALARNGTLAAATAESIGAHDRVDGALAEHAVIDEEVLRQMVSDIVRQELQGVLGERITRNVRKLVRREIHRVVMSQEFD